MALSDLKPDAGESLSALADGELDAAATRQVCAQWRDEADTRARWHAYQLIGDVLRSDALASSARRDAQFLAALQQRLAHEPTVLAPVVAPARMLTVPAASTAPRWLFAPTLRAVRAPLAAAAGFALVVGVLVATQLPVGGLSAVETSANAEPALSSADQPERPDAAVLLPAGLDAQVIRDARLDEYLAAHKKFGGSSTLGAPSGALRHAAAQQAR
jgi:sigma-E factor negative regulatory protein RseA